MDRLFWAKLRGYPWWPAIIENFDGASFSKSDEKNINQIPIRFLGSHDFALVARSNLKPFLENWQQYASKGSSSKFKQALKEAREYVTLPLLNQTKKKARGRPPKSVSVLRERRIKLIRYSEKKLQVIFGRSRPKTQEFSIASRILYILTLLDSKELKANMQTGKALLATGLSLVHQSHLNLDADLKNRLDGYVSRLLAIFV